MRIKGAIKKKYFFITFSSFYSCSNKEPGFLQILLLYLQHNLSELQDPFSNIIVSFLQPTLLQTPAQLPQKASFQKYRFSSTRPNVPYLSKSSLLKDTEVKHGLLILRTIQF